MQKKNPNKRGLSPITTFGVVVCYLVLALNVSFAAEAQYTWINSPCKHVFAEAYPVFGYNGNVYLSWQVTDSGIEWEGSPHYVYDNLFYVHAVVPWYWDGTRWIKAQIVTNRLVEKLGEGELKDNPLLPPDYQCELVKKELQFGPPVCI